MLDLSAAAVLVLFARAAGTGFVTANFFTGGNGDLLWRFLSWRFPFLDSDFVNSVNDVVLYAGNEALEKGMALFFISDDGIDLPGCVQDRLLAQMVHLG